MSSYILSYLQLLRAKADSVQSKSLLLQNFLPLTDASTKGCNSQSKLKCLTVSTDWEVKVNLCLVLLLLLLPSTEVPVPKELVPAPLMSLLFS